MQRTLANCSLIKRQAQLGVGKPEQYYNLNKCLGYASGDNDEPCEQCKSCSLNLSFEEE